MSQCTSFIQLLLDAKMEYIDESPVIAFEVNGKALTESFDNERFMSADQGDHWAVMWTEYAVYYTYELEDLSLAVRRVARNPPPDAIKF